MQRVIITVCLLCVAIVSCRELRPGIQIMIRDDLLNLNKAASNVQFHTSCFNHFYPLHIAAYMKQDDAIIACQKEASAQRNLLMDDVRSQRAQVDSVITGISKSISDCLGLDLLNRFICYAELKDRSESLTSLTNTASDLSDTLRESNTLSDNLIDACKAEANKEYETASAKLTNDYIVCLENGPPSKLTKPSTLLAIEGQKNPAQMIVQSQALFSQKAMQNNADPLTNRFSKF